MRRLLSVVLSVLMLNVQTGVAGQPGAPLPTVEQLDAAVAEQALTDHFRRSEAGRMDEPKLAVNPSFMGPVGSGSSPPGSRFPCARSCPWSEVDPTMRISIVGSTPGSAARI